MLEASGKAADLEVFIVDSDERCCQELRLITEACGYRVQTFADGQPALERLRDDEPCLVIVELLLPVLDGFELCQAIRGELGYADLPILCTTGISWGSVNLAELLERRFQARFLAKGMLVERYLATLQELMRRLALEEESVEPAEPEGPRNEKNEHGLREVANLQLQAESVVRAVMADELDQGESEEVIREQTDSVVQAVLQYRKRLERVQPSGEYHYAKPVNAPPAQPPPDEEPAPPPLEELEESDSQVIAKVGTVRLGESGVRRTRELTREFQREFANVETSAQRREVRVCKAFQVRIEDLDSLDAEYTDNISAGGLFIRTGKPPEKDTLITISIELPDQNRVVEAQARVIHTIEPEQAKVMGRRPGCGVEFVNLAAGDRQLLREVIQQEYTRPGQVTLTEDGQVEWIVLLGLPVLPMVGRPNLLLRNNIRMVEFPNLPAASGFMAGRRVALVIIGEAALAGTGAEKFRQELDQVLSEGTQHLYLDPNSTMKNILDEIGRRLNLQSRASPRIPYQSGVSVKPAGDEKASPGDFTARMINLSCSGMLFSTATRIPIGSVLHLVFGLPDGLEIRCRGEVVRMRQEEDSPETCYGVAFQELFGDAEYQLELFVQNQIDFRDFFRWMKKRYFEYP